MIIVLKQNLFDSFIFFCIIEATCSPRFSSDQRAQGELFVFPLMATSYTKHPLSCIDQLDLLKQRGLCIDDDAKALHLLQHISYYRLSGYWYTLLEEPKVEQHFKSNASFQTAFKIYCFDRELRQLVLGEIEKIEVAVKSQMIQVLSQGFGPNWYADPARFMNHKNNHTKTLEKLLDDYKHSREDFIIAFKKTHADVPPPCWVIMEIASFGRISSLYADLRGGKSKRSIANHFGLDDSSFASWLHCIGYLRNICAHHSRFWNREFRLAPQVPQHPSKIWLQNYAATNRAYFMLSMILYFLQTINQKNTFNEKFSKLLGKYPNIDSKAMGFPVTWQSERLWSDQVMAVDWVD